MGAVSTVAEERGYFCKNYAVDRSEISILLVFILWMLFRPQIPTWTKSVITMIEPF